MLKKETKWLASITLLAFLIAIFGSYKLYNKLKPEETSNIRQGLKEELKDKEVPNLDKILNLVENSNTRAVRGYRNINVLKDSMRGKIEVMRLIGNIKDVDTKLAIITYLVNEHSYYPIEVGRQLSRDFQSGEKGERQVGIMNAELNLIGRYNSAKDSFKTSRKSLILVATVIMVLGLIVTETLDQRGIFIPLLISIVYVMAFVYWINLLDIWMLEVYII